MCHSPLKLVLRMYLSRVFPSAASNCGQTPGWSGHKSRCMLWRAWAMAYTASITNCTLPSCSYLESIPMRSWPEGRRGRGGLKSQMHHEPSDVTFPELSLSSPLPLFIAQVVICCCYFCSDSNGIAPKATTWLRKQENTFNSQEEYMKLGHKKVFTVWQIQQTLI